MCLYGRVMRNKRYTPTIKNGGVIPEVKYSEDLMITTKCGVCIECRKQWMRDWRIRLTNEWETGGQETYFGTMTLSEGAMEELIKQAKIDDPNKVAIIAIRKWRERVRKATGKSPRYWAVTELGGRKTQRLHIHMLIFGGSIDVCESKWAYGNTWVEKIRGQGAITYVSKYLLKEDPEHKTYKPRVLCSQGIGRESIERHRDKWRKEKKIRIDGKELPIPDYYKRKIWSDEERIDMRYEGERSEIYVMGTKYPIDTEEEQINAIRAIASAREESKRLGFGDPTMERMKWKCRNSNVERPKESERKITCKSQFGREVTIRDSENELWQETWRSIINSTKTGEQTWMITKIKRKNYEYESNNWWSKVGEWE